MPSPHSSQQPGLPCSWATVQLSVHSPPSPCSHDQVPHAGVNTYVLEDTIPPCISFLGLRRQIATSWVTQKTRNVLSHSSGGHVSAR